MIAIRVCPICKKAFEGRVGVPKVYCDECTMLSDYAAMDTARSQAAWFFEDFGDEDEREDEKHESEQETDTAPTAKSRYSKLKYTMAVPVVILSAKPVTAKNTRIRIAVTIY